MSSSWFVRTLPLALVASLLTACGSAGGPTDGATDGREVGHDVAPDTGSDASTIDTAADVSPDGVAPADTSPATDAPDSSDAPASVAANAACALATAVTDGTHLIAEDPHAATAPDPGCRYTSGYGVLYYAATIPAGNALVAVVTPTTGTFLNAYLGVLDHCGPASTCLGQQESGVNRTTVVYRNDGSTAQSVILVVADQPAASESRFDLAITIRPMDTATPACVAATPVTNGTTVHGSTGATTDVSAACLLADSGTVAYYSAVIPAGQVLVARAQIPGAARFTGDLSIRVLESCAATRCLTAIDSPATGVTNVASYFNPGPGAQSVILEVGSWLDEDVSPFDLSVQIVPPAANASCANATAVADGTMLTGEDTAVATSGVTACDARDPASALYYAVSIPSGYTLVAMPTGPGGAWASLATRVLDGCGATVCLANAAAHTLDQVARVIYTNASAAPLQAILAISSADGASAVPFDLAVSVLAPAANTTCATATPVVDGTSLPYENAADATSALSAACLPTATGGVLYYRATVPAGQTLTAIATPISPWDTVVRLLDACTTTGCVTSAASGPVGAPEVLNYTNAGTTPADVTLAVGSASGAAGLFGLQVSIGPLPYVPTMIPNACEDLGGVPSTLRPGPTGLAYGTGSMPYALPFSFSFMGTPMTHVSLAQWGYVQLLAGATGDTTTFAGAHAIPYPARPNGIVAPFWANLVAPSSPTAGPTDVRLAGSVGVAPMRHTTIEWRNWTPLSSDSVVTFQARLYENGTIEFHYCSGFTSGSAAQATLGAEDATGTHGFDAARAGVADVTHALRLTPTL